MAPDILFIGAGITSALSASFIQKTVPAANIILWDKARGIGGRMSRSINPEDSSCSVDLGAQYVTTNVQTMAKYDDIYGPLLRDNVIEGLTANVLGMKEFGDNTRHFVAPLGMNSIVKYFLCDLPKENIRFSSRVVAIDEANGKFVVKSEKDACEVDVVVSTMPVPQFLQLSGSVKSYVENDAALNEISYSSRFVLVLFFDKTVKFPKTDWACRYLDDNVFRYVSIDNIKRNRADDPVAVVLHTTVKFGIEHLETGLQEMEPILLEQVRKLFPDWPKPSSVKSHKWRFSQVVKPFTGKPGCLVLHRNPTLILGGDAFSDSNFDGCIYSAQKITDAIREIAI